MLGDGCQDMDGEPVRLREIDGRELDARLHQAGDEVNVAREPVELGDDERGATDARRLAAQLGSLAPRFSNSQHKSEESMRVPLTGFCKVHDF